MSDFVPDYVREIARLHGEIERLRADSQQLDILTEQWNVVTKEAREEIERLRAALKDCLDCLDKTEVSPSFIIGAVQRGRRALEGK